MTTADGHRTTAGVSVEVDAPPERVWDVVADPRHLPRWERHILSIENIPSDGLSKGASYTVVMRFVAIRAKVRAEVLEWSPPGYACVRLSGLLDATIRTTVSPIGRSHSRLEHDVEYSFKGGALGDLAARSLQLLGGAQLALKIGALAQKRSIESGAE
ncbi:MAG: SRPBCC family protein [Actinomycetota bacterium]